MPRIRRFAFGSRFWAISVFAGAALVALLHLLHFPSLEHWKDSSEYLAPATRLWRGQMIDLDSHRSHGGAWFYFFLLQLSFGRWFMVLIFQKIMMLAIPVAVAFWLRRCLERETILNDKVAAWLWVLVPIAIFLNPNLHQYSHMAGIELPAAFCVAAALFFQSLSDHRAGVRRWVLAVLIPVAFMAWAIIMRPQAIGFVVLLALNPLRSWFRLAPVIGVAFLLLSYCALNLTSRGFFAIASAGGLNRLSYAVPLSATTSHGNWQGSDDQVIVDTLQAAAGAAPDAILPATHLWEQGGVIDRLRRKTGFSLADLNDALSRVAVHLILEQPRKALRLVGREIGNFFLRDENGFNVFFSPYMAYKMPRAAFVACQYSLGSGDPRMQEVCRGEFSSPFPRGATLVVYDFLRAMSNLWNLIFVKSLFLLLPIAILRWRHVPDHVRIFVLAIVGTAVVSAAASWTDARFRFPLEPILPAYLFALAISWRALMGRRSIKSASTACQ